MDKKQNEKLIMIHNTMGQIETKGQSTIFMAGCMQGIEELIKENMQQAPVEEKIKK
jgi:hypothetical protein